MGLPVCRFTLDDLDFASEVWGCNCGPAALAAVLGLTFAEVRPCMGDFERKGYTNPSLMLESLARALERHGERQWSYRGLTRHEPVLDWPEFGLARIQWEGPWCAPGVPMRARYRHTHWVGAYRHAADNVAVFDVNAISLRCPSGWTPLDAWRSILVPAIIEQCVPRGDGRWHITHAIEIAA